MDDERAALALAADAAPAPVPVLPAVDPSQDAAPTAAPDSFSFTAAPTAPEAAPASTAPTEGSAPGRRLSVAAVWGATALAVVVLTGFLVLIVSGRVVTEGPVLLELSRSHGVHLGDLAALGAWCLAVAALMVAARR